MDVETYRSRLFIVFILVAISRLIFNVNTFETYESSIIVPHAQPFKEWLPKAAIPSSFLARDSSSSSLPLRQAQKVS